MKIFIVAQELELVCYYGQARKLHCSLTKTGALEQAFQHGKAYGVIMPQSWSVNKYPGNVWLRGLWKWRKFLCLRKSEATSLDLIYKF